MSPMRIPSPAAGAFLALTALLSACNGNDAGSVPPPSPPTPVAMSTVSGRAAIGAPITAAAISLRCGDGSTASASSGSDGAWTVQVPTTALPCAIQLSGGSVAAAANAETFYSLARGSSAAAIANITPLTDLALAQAVNTATGLALDAWFGGANLATQLPQVASGIDAAVAALRAALTTAGYTLPAADFDPVIAAIAPGTAGDAYDGLLDLYAQALSTASRSYAAARGDFTSGGALAAAPSTPPPPVTDVVSGPLTAPGSATLGAFFGALAGDYRLQVSNVYGGAEGEFPNASLHSVQILADGTVNLIGNTQTVSYRYVQRTLSDYTQDNPGTATEKDIARYYAANGSSIDLFITYEPALGYLTLTAQGFAGAESGVLLVSRQRDVTPPPLTPTTPADSLAAQLSAAYVGQYVVACPTDSGGTVNRTIVINADGTGSVDGLASVDASNGGGVILQGNSAYSSLRQSGSYTSRFLLQFLPDGSIQPAAVNVIAFETSKSRNCTGVSGRANLAAVNAAAIVGGYARTATLNCPASTAAGVPSGSTAFSIAADGSMSLGVLWVSPAQYNEYKSYYFEDSTTYAPADNAFASHKQVISVGYTPNGTLDTTNLSLSVDASGAILGVRYQYGFTAAECTP
ncbi:hypothetical protein [Nevskia ramosa]|uniref:hypothetical protein n=1 Tax=Nevskia ramosa TaxID=64002 RepID=UPI002354E66C|nr:hypothetical protein [Nevskia ramosa]